MKDPVLLNKMWQEVEAGRVSASQMGSLTIFKYTQGTHIEGTWNEVNRVARGIIFDVDGTIVARPFPKFFNMNELSESEPKNLPWKEGVEVYEKLDGSCGAGYFVPGPSLGEEAPPYADGVCAGYFPTWRLATPGSMVSDQAIKGTEMLQGYDLKHLPTDCTPVFEIIYPENQIVVNYGGETFLALLAIFEHNGVEWHPRRVDQIAELCGFSRPRRYDIDIRESIPFENNEEGYVCRFGNGYRIKVKSPRYLQLHRLLDNLSPKGVVSLIRGKEYGPTIGLLPQELVLRFDDVRAHVQGLYNEILTAASEKYRELMSTLGENAGRKEQAQWIIANVPGRHTGLIFSMLDDKELDDSIWKMVLESVREAAEV